MIENHILREEKDLSFNYSFANLFDLKKIPNSLKDEISFLVTKLSFIYNAKDYNSNSPFIPFISYTSGERTPTFEDLSEEDFRFLTLLLEKTEHPLFKGRFYDILGAHSKNKNDILNAANEYFRYFQSSLYISKNYNLCDALKRALFLYWKSDKKGFWAHIDSLFDSTTYTDPIQQLLVFDYAIEVLETLKQQLKQNHITSLENTLNAITKTTELIPKLEAIPQLIQYYKKNSNSGKINFWKNEYVNICITLDESFSYGYSYLQKALNILDSHEDSEKINKLRFLLEKSQKKVFDKMQFISPKLNPSLKKGIEDYGKFYYDSFQNNKSGVAQFMLFLNSFNPITSKQIKKFVALKKDSIAHRLCNNILFDQNGAIIYESANASDEDSEEYLISQAINDSLSLPTLILDAWKKYRILDANLKDLLFEITSHNLLIPQDRVQTVYAFIIEGLETDELSRATFNLIAQFENGCRNYLKEKCNIFPIVDKGGNSIPMNLNHILVQKRSSPNKNREKIVDLLGEDLTLGIEYLACRKLSGNLRNCDYHYGFNNSKEYNHYELVLFYLLIKAYCMAYDSDFM